MEEIKIGSHVGMAGKEMFLASVKEAERYGANVLMLYTGAPQNTRRKEIKDLNIEAGWEYATKAGIREIVVHAPYIINLANTVKPETFELAVEFLEKEIRRTAAMRSKILVLHPGSALDAGAEAGIAQTVRGLNMVLDANGDDVFIALETMAGKGSEIGRTFEEIRAIYDGVHKKERLRVCFDTCHVNDAVALRSNAQPAVSLIVFDFHCCCPPSWICCFCLFSYFFSPRRRFAESRTASTIFSYPVHRQRLPESATRISSSLGFGLTLSSAIVVSTMPGVQ